MRRRRKLPPWRRLLLEYVAMLAVYFAAFIVSGNLLIGLIAMIVAMFLIRMTRPKPDGPPPGER